MTIPGLNQPSSPANWTPADVAFMAQARVLARLGAGRTWTNPMVGAVVVTDGEVVGAAFHHRLGEAHAEALALAEAGDRARGGTLYVSLEPCAHQGQTPPCVALIHAAGIVRVVISAPDPDPRVRGRGMTWLHAHGIRIDAGCDAASAILDNHGYYHDRLGIARTVTLKMASSRDGMVARGRNRRDGVTAEAAQIDVHRLRAVHDAVLIGAGTARIDRPRLDCRLLPDGVEREPVMVVFDTSLSLAGETAWPGLGREYVMMGGEHADTARVRAIESRGGRVLLCALKDGHIDVGDALDRLAGIGMKRMLVEGGPQLFQSVIAAGTWDALWHYQSNADFGPAGLPMVAPEERAQFEAVRGAAVDETRLGEDVCWRYLRGPSRDHLLGELAAKVAAAAEGK